MHFPGLLPSCLGLLLANNVIANDAIHADTCYKGENSSLLCYSPPDGTPQDVFLGDIIAIAAHLRTFQGRFWTMKAKDTPNCAEWTVFSLGSVLVLAKHIDLERDSSVLYDDIATTLDGGPDAKEKDRRKALIGCRTDGGSLGVLVNATNPAYKTDTYKKAGYTPEGILIKVVASGPREL